MPQYKHCLIIDIYIYASFYVFFGKKQGNALFLLSFDWFVLLLLYIYQ